jgi:hypothetical protein
MWPAPAANRAFRTVSRDSRGTKTTSLRFSTSRLLYRLDQLEPADDTGEELVLHFEEHEGIAKLARLAENGLDVELFHNILTFT